MSIDQSNLEIGFYCNAIQLPNELPFSLAFINVPVNTFYRISNIVTNGNLITSMDIDFCGIPVTPGYMSTNHGIVLGTHTNRPSSYTPPAPGTCANRTSGIGIVLNMNITVNHNPPNPNPSPIRKPYDTATHKG